MVTCFLAGTDFKTKKSNTGTFSKSIMTVGECLLQSRQVLWRWWVQPSQAQTLKKCDFCEHMNDFRECMRLLWSRKSQMILREVGKVLVRSKVKMYSGGTEGSYFWDGCWY